MSKKAIVIAVGLTILLLFVLASFVTPSSGLAESAAGWM
jgi:hypothetical protein